MYGSQPTQLPAHSESEIASLSTSEKKQTKGCQEKIARLFHNKRKKMSHTLETPHFY
jgi:hypothetical protein